MFDTYLAEFSAAWKTFIRIPLPAFLSGGRESDYDEIDGHSALLRPMMPLIGTHLGLLTAFPLWLLNLFFHGHFAAGLAGAAVVPLALELLNSWGGLNALTSYIELRRQGASQEEAIRTAPVPMNAPRSGASMLMLMTLYFLRMVFCGVLAYFSPVWFVIAFTCAWLVRAQLVSLNAPGGFGRAWIETPRGWEQRHWHIALAVLLVIGILHFGIFHLFAALLAFGVAWAAAWYAGNLCLDAVSGVTRQALEIFGYAAEIVLLFLGVLLYAAP